MTNKDFTAGDDVDSRCLKCKAVTNHTIIAMQDEQIAKVQCNTCGGRHNYRPVKPVAKKAVRRSAGKLTPAKARARVSKEEKQAEYFEKVMAGQDQAKALPYAMSSDYNDNDLINHPTFGLGVVTRKISPTRIEVVFREALKVLVCATSD
jgi:hypothetical protein